MLKLALGAIPAESRRLWGIFASFCGGLCQEGGRNTAIAGGTLLSNETSLYETYFTLL